MSGSDGVIEPIKVVFARLAPLDVSTAGLTLDEVDRLEHDAVRAGRWCASVTATLRAVRRSLLADPNPNPVPITPPGAGADLSGGAPSDPAPVTPVTPVARSSREDKRANAIDRTVQRFASFGTALAAGRVSEEHLLAVDRLPQRHLLVPSVERELLEAASSRSAETFARWLSQWAARSDGRALAERQHERRAVATFPGDDGMGIVRATLKPAEFDAFKRTLYDIDAQLRRGSGADPAATWDQRLHDALIEMMHRANAATRRSTVDSGGSLRTAIVVVIELRDLLAGTGHGVALDGAPVDIGEIRRLAASAHVIPAVLGADSEVLDLGRARRYATDAQWLALHLRQGGCWNPDCDAPVGTLDAHHLHPWNHGGRTDLDNLALGCTTHHRIAHATGQAVRNTDGRVHITAPDGTTTVSPNRTDRSPRRRDHPPGDAPDDGCRSATGPPARTRPAPRWARSPGAA